MHFCTEAVVHAKIDAHTARVAMWRAVDPATLRPEPTVLEQRMPIDLAIAAEMVLDNGETNDIDEIKRRTDVTLRRVSEVNLRPEPR